MTRGGARRVTAAARAARGPSSDLTDLYMFMTSRDNVALVMNVNGLTQSQGGPNYNPLDNSHVYQLHIDNDFDAHEDITFQFVAGSRYINNGRGFEVDVQGHKVPIPLAHFGPVTANPDTRAVSGLNVEEYYRVRVLHGDDYSSPIEDGPFAFRFVAGGETTREFHKVCVCAVDGARTSRCACGPTSRRGARVCAPTPTRRAPCRRSCSAGTTGAPRARTK